MVTQIVKIKTYLISFKIIAWTFGLVVPLGVPVILSLSKISIFKEEYILGIIFVVLFGIAAGIGAIFNKYIYNILHESILKDINSNDDPDPILNIYKEEGIIFSSAIVICEDGELLLEIKIKPPTILTKYNWNYLCYFKKNNATGLWKYYNKFM